jgi:hypothetical protein
MCKYRVFALMDVKFSPNPLVVGHGKCLAVADATPLMATIRLLIQRGEGRRSTANRFVFQPKN